MRSYQGLTPHPDGVAHERLPMANVARVTRNVDLPLPGIIKSAKPTGSKPTLSGLAMAEKQMLHFPVELHHEGGRVPATKMTPGMIAVERRC